MPTTLSENRAGFNKTDLLFLLVLMLLVGLFRAMYIGDRGLAGDEKYSLTTSQFISPEGGNLRDSMRDSTQKYFMPQQVWRTKTMADFQEAIARRENGSGAIYFLSVHYWSKVFGVRDGALRFPSLLYNLLLLPLLFLFSKRHFSYSRYTPYLVTLAAAASPFYFHYAIAARNYALTFTLILAATYFFLNLLKETKPFWQSGNFWAYSVLSAMFIFGHHSALAVLPLHVLITLMSGKWKRLSAVFAAMLLPFLCMYAWTLSEGGRYTYEFIEDSNDQYVQVAKDGSEAMVKFSTPRHIMQQFTQVFTYLYLPVSGLYDKLLGLRNTLLAIGSGGLLAVALLLHGRQKLRLAMAAAALIVPYFFYTVSPHLFSLAAVGLSIIGVGGWLYFRNFKEVSWQTVALMSVVPMILMIFYAWRDGVTIRINARYAGFGYAFTLLLLVVSLEYIARRVLNKYWVVLYILLVIGFIIIPENRRIITDDIPQYYQFVKGNRLPNPYATLADKIVANYAPGDTVLYCSKPLPKLPGNSAAPDFSLEDALYTSIYLPPHATYIQRGDTTETDKVYLWKHQLQRKILLEDLTDKRY